MTLTHTVRNTYTDGDVFFKVWHNNSAVSDITYTVSDSSSGGGESGGGSGGGESGETKTVTIESGKETDLRYNDAHSDVAVSSIMIDAKGISGDNQMWVRFKSNNNEWVGNFYIKNYNNTLSKDAESNCKVSLDGAIFTISDFKDNLNRITLTRCGIYPVKYVQ